LLSPRRIEENGIFNPKAVTALVKKAKQGKVIGVKDNMSIVGILSTQLLIQQFLQTSTPTSSDTEPVQAASESDQYNPV